MDIQYVGTKIVVVTLANGNVYNVAWQYNDITEEFFASVTRKNVSKIFKGSSIKNVNKKITDYLKGL